MCKKRIHRLAPNFFWDSTIPESKINKAVMSTPLRALKQVHGQFSLVLENEKSVLLARDRFGINKLFYGIAGDDHLAVSHYMVDLYEKEGIDYEDIFSVPAGHYAIFDKRSKRMLLYPYFTLKQIDNCSPEYFNPDTFGVTVKKRLLSLFQQIKQKLEDRPVHICLSGGLDSSGITALAKQVFKNVIVYSFTLCKNGRLASGNESDDFKIAKRLASLWKLEFRPVISTWNNLVALLPDCLRYGQDWRDFNVHCAIINAALAKAIVEEQDKRGIKGRPIALTGDIMNELTADYTPIDYLGEVYYHLPRVSKKTLRYWLMVGLDSTDREVGIFNHFGVSVIQPYAAIAEDYLKIPGSYLNITNAKQVINSEVFGDAVPNFVTKRKKTRAQIGNEFEVGGTLKAFVEAKIGSSELEELFRKHCGIPENLSLTNLIDLGKFRFKE